MSRQSIKSIIILTFLFIGTFFGLPTRAATISTSNAVNLTKGLAGWWTFDGTSVNAVKVLDKSGNNNNGTRAGTQSVIGKIGQAMSFDGLNDSIAVGGQSSLNITETFTISVWVRPDDIISNKYILSKSVDVFDLIIGYQDNNVNFFNGVYHPNAGASQMAVTQDVWQHVVYTKGADGTANNWRGYINGVEKFSLSTDFTLGAGVSDFYIGSNQGADQFFDGALDDVRIYNRSLTRAEVKAIYQQGAGNKISKSTPANSWATQGLVGWWTFDGKDVNANYALDKSGYNNNAARVTASSTITDLTVTTTVAAGKIGQAMNFNGYNSFVSSTDSNSLDATSTITLSAWVKRNERSREEGIITKGSYSLKIGSDDRPFFEMTTGSEAMVNVGAGSVDTLFVYRGRLYGNGSGGDSGIRRWDGGTDWSTYFCESLSWWRNFAAYNGDFYAVGTSENVYRYNGGSSCVNVGTPATGFGLYALNVYKNKLYVTTDDGNVYRYDDGTTWTDVGDPGPAGNLVRELTVWSGGLYAADTDGDIYRYDGGTTWTSIGDPGPAGHEPGSLIVYQGKLYWGGDNYTIIYRYDGDTTWTDVAGSENTRAKRGFAAYGGRLYLGQYGSYVTRYNGGDSWTAMTGGPTLPQNIVTYDGKLYIGSDDGVGVYAMGAGKAVYASSTVPAGLWTHISATYNGSVLKIYINGKLDSSTTTPYAYIPENNNFPLLIGSSFGASRGALYGTHGEENFDGLIDDARVYNKTLSAAEIKQLYQQGAGMKAAVAPAANVGGTGLSKGLVSYWTFDGKDMGASKALDKVGNNDGVRNGGVSVAPGKLGQGLKFDGMDDYINASDVSTQDWTNLSVSTWVYWTANGIGGYAGVYYKNGGTGDLGRLLIADSGQLLLQNANGNFFSNAAGDVSKNRWSNIVYVYNQSAGQEYLYVDGALKGQQARTGNISQDINNLLIGTGFDDIVNYMFTGKIDDFRVYNRALSKTEIQQLYRMGK